MRLHRLRVTAFQAFAASEEIDFDALGAAGLFLLHGDTGAGKTTLLDAVCFALYGDVPGARSRESRLRSDHADPGVRTEVELEVTLRDRRFRVVRRPKQVRPKLRGDGVTEEPAACTVQELRDEEWVTIAARPDEARAELADPLGMTCDQFCQVVLLPQGEFAAFLRAGSDERWRLLERLFGTERFAAVEWWLRDRRRAARAELEQQLRDVRDVVSRLSQVAGEPAPGGWEDELEAVREWAGGLGVTTEASAATAEEASAGARAARIGAERALADGTELSGRRARLATALSELESWRGRRGVRDAAEQELLAARRAAPVAALLETARARAAESSEAAAGAEAAWSALDDEARAAADAAPAVAPAPSAEPRSIALAEDQRSTAAPPEHEVFTLFDLPPLEPEPAPARGGEPEAGGEPRPAALRAHAGELRTRAGALGALVAVEERLADDEQALATLAQEAERASEAAARSAQALERAGEERTRLDEELQAARRAADRVEALAAESRGAAERADRATERDRLLAAGDAIADRVRAAVDAHQAAHAAWLDLRERRLAGMAAELAADLAPGEPCAVCGSAEHPSPAHLADAAEAAPAEAAPAGATAPTPLAEQERAAQERLAGLAEEREGCERQAAAHGEALAAARAVAGDAPAAELGERARRLSHELEAASALAGQLAATERALEALATTTAEHERRRRTAEQTMTTARAAHAERSAALETDRARVAEARGGAATITARVGSLRASADACEAAAAALEHAARTGAAHVAAAEAAEQAALDAGFRSADAARAAVRDHDTQEQLERRLREFDEGLAQRTALIQDERLQAAAAEPAPDLDALREQAAAATRADEAAHGRLTVDRRRHADVIRLAADLDGALEQLAPVAARARLASDVAALVDGSSASNRLRMRLAAYVLAARLEEVAEAATARLERMSNGRYAIVHSDGGGKGQRRGGLDLRILDGWTGEERSPATLSGGETFLASLALALGLADVVAADAGGSRLETLFIDEGFGSLDERTLDEVLDVLDALREGGRAVGIVSHVAELRQRVPAKLHVVKGRDGSHVEQSATPAAA